MNPPFLLPPGGGGVWVVTTVFWRLNPNKDGWRGGLDVWKRRAKILRVLRLWEEARVKGVVNKGFTDELKFRL